MPAFGSRQQHNMGNSKFSPPLEGALQSIAVDVQHVHYVRFLKGMKASFSLCCRKHGNVEIGSITFFSKQNHFEQTKRD